MIPGRVLLAGAVLCGFAPHLQAQERIVRDIQLVGAHELPHDIARAATGVRIGEPLAVSPEQTAESVARKYRDEGFSFAVVGAVFDESNGTLTLTIDEGVIDDVEFTGVDRSLAESLARDFAVRAGDVFNRVRAGAALDALLRPSRGAFRPRRQRAFEVNQRNGRRVLTVGVRDPAGDVRVVPNLGEREDWFTAVDGFVPSLGFGGAVFDHRLFNHAYVAGHLSYKMAAGRAGYALGFERPLFEAPKLYVGAELYDLTATDDRWQVSGLEASVDALAARKSFRDYYRRRGAQLHAALQVERHLEFLFAWRGERHEPLAVDSRFSVWNRDDEFRPNLAAAEGRLNAVLFGASLDSYGFPYESLAATYRRHQLESPFGERQSAGEHHPDHGWRAAWTSEIASPGSLGGDFSFRRHIVSGSARRRLSRREELRVRGVAGWSAGVLPPQRRFAAGGIGTVHGYRFKEAVGDTLALVNVEYAVGRLQGPHFVAFFDSARVGDSAPSTARWLRGVGFGVGFTRALRLDFGYKLNDIPGSLQVLFRIDRTF